MLTTRRSFTTLSLILISLLAPAAARAQTQRPESQSQPPVVTASASPGRVRYAALGEVHQTRLQVFSPDGGQAFDSGFRLGNLVTWRLTDQQGSRLADGAYLFLVTVKDFSGNLTQKHGTSVLEKGRVYLEQTSRDEIAGPQATALEANKLTEAVTPIDRLGAAGFERAEATDSTEGTAGGDTQASGKGESTAPGDGIEPSVSGAGTTGKLTKWTDGPAEVLGDSIVTELSGKIGIATATPRATLDIKQSADSFVGGIHLRRSTTNDTWTFVTGGDNKLYMGYANNASGADAAGDFTIRPLVLTPTNRVGIGTPDPAAMLHVAGDVNFLGLRTEGVPLSPNVIGGSVENIVRANVIGGTISGGGNQLDFNLVTDDFGTIGGGANNVAGDNAGETSDKPSATVGGGSFNIASGASSTIGGGAFNTASGTGSTVGGGSVNTASGSVSTVPGGSLNMAQGDFSLAAGRRAQALQQGSFVWADSTNANFASTGVNQFLIRAAGGVGIGTNAPNHQLTIGVPEVPNVTSARVGIYGAGPAYLIARDTTNNVEALFGAEVGAALFGSMTNHNVQFRTNNDTRMVITSNGNVGVGTTSPGTAKVKVQGGHLFVANPNSLVITSVNGACWKIVVSNAGALSASSVACP